MLHVPVDNFCKYKRFLGYLGLIVAAPAETRREED